MLDTRAENLPELDRTGGLQHLPGADGATEVNHDVHASELWL